MRFVTVWAACRYRRHGSYSYSRLLHAVARSGALFDTSESRSVARLLVARCGLSRGGSYVRRARSSSSGAGRGLRPRMFWA